MMEEDPSNASDVEPEQSTSKVKNKTVKSGVLYLSSVPEGMNVAYICDYLQYFGEIGRTFFKPHEFSLNRKIRVYKEGWVEYVNYKSAKKAAKGLNTKEVPGKKKRWSGSLWNMKYLKNFDWDDVFRAERLERHTHLLKKQSDIMQSKRVAREFKESLAQSKLEDSMRKRRGDKFQERNPKVFSQKSSSDNRKQSYIDYDSSLKAVNNQNFMSALLGGKKL